MTIDDLDVAPVENIVDLGDTLVVVLAMLVEADVEVAARVGQLVRRKRLARPRRPA